MRIVVIGTGYVGLVAGAGLSDFGNEVTCVDIDPERVASLERGEIPFYEPNLDALVTRNTGAGRLRFSTDTAAAVSGAEVIFLTVGTPPADSGAADLGPLAAAAQDIARGLTDWTVIVTKSTVPVGTTARLGRLIRDRSGREVAMASNPEFLKEGDAVNDFMKPQRVILGVDSDRALQRLRALYSPILRTSDRIHVMDIASAELTKYAANAMLATRISFMNELALLAERVGADIEPIRRAMGADQRIGANYLFAGAGFGGSCFPKDLRALLHSAGEAGVELGVVAAAGAANERQKQVLGERIIEHFAGDLSGRRIAVWGLSFKPETDDIREAPALVLIDQLVAAGARVSAYDPVARERVRERLGDAIELAGDMYAAAEGSDALVLVTEWHLFRRPDFARLRALMRTPMLVDGRNVWSPDELARMGFRYYGVGRPGTHAAAPSTGVK